MTSTSTAATTRCIEAFTSTGLRPPDALNLIPRTIFDDPDPTAPPDRRHFYDQIAWFTHGRATLNLDFVNAGTFDFTNNLIPAATTNQLSWRISDHYPLWSEFTVRQKDRHRPGGRNAPVEQAVARTTPPSR